MSWVYLSILASLLVSSAMVRAADPAAPTGGTPAPEPKDIATDSGFAVDLYARLASARPGKNLFFSPYSLRTALVMTYSGARGETADQMASVLHLPKSPPQNLHGTFADLKKQLTDKTADAAERYELTTANALWGQAGYGFRPEFKDQLERDYGATLNEVDFLHHAEPVRVQINDWAQHETHDKIKDLIPPGLLTPATRLVLTNAIYFKAGWAEAFVKAGTRDEAFHLDASHEVQAPMMHRRPTHLSCLDNDTFQAVELPYKGGQLSMVLVVPKAVDGLASVEKSLTAENLRNWFAGMQGKQVALAMPKFKMTNSFQLAEQLKAMGMTDAFDAARADFTGMVTAQQAKEELPPVISEVVHKSFVSVDEEGTEAAAASAVVMLAGAARADRPLAIVADRPFLFLIRHQASGAVLFLGRVTDPRAEETSSYTG